MRTTLHTALFLALVSTFVQSLDAQGFGRGRRGGGGPGRTLAPKELPAKDGVAAIQTQAEFKKLSYNGPDVLIDTHLRHIAYVKFQIMKAGSAAPAFYWINTKTHRSHMSFMRSAGISMGRGGMFGRRGGRGGGEQPEQREATMRGVLCYYPMLAAPNGERGLYTFEFEPFDRFPFRLIQIAHDEVIKHAPFMKDRLAFYPIQNAKPVYDREKALYDKAKLPIYFPSERFKNIAFLPLNIAQGYGRLRLMKTGERPSPRDIVLYKSLPNEMPRVAGVITAVRQTPLSHVNLRAVQDRVPNAFIKDVATNPKVTQLLGKYVYYKVASDAWEIRGATTAEVDKHFANLRPKKAQTPKRDLTKKNIRPLKKVGFKDSVSIGVKAANLATLHEIGFPKGVVPNGFAVPFYFYDEFMKHNGLYAKAKAMIATPGFADDTDKRAKALAEFQKQVIASEMPKALQEALGKMRATWPKTRPIRCRSSTNNEDLPKFSGAGLYDSVTHRTEEGHIAKTIKMVYASLWNFRAYEEREFFRIDHYTAAMGVLVHPNQSNEKANGVAVTDDIVYQTKSNNYVNAQVGEDLVTNPEGDSIPEELLLHVRYPRNDKLLRTSNRVRANKRLLSKAHVDDLRVYLDWIYEEFKKLYGKGRNDKFAMEIEFKITEKGKLQIKQARPWIY